MQTMQRRYKSRSPFSIRCTTVRRNISFVPSTILKERDARQASFKPTSLVKPIAPCTCITLSIVFTAFSSSAMANTMQYHAYGEFDVHNLHPIIRQPPPSGWTRAFNIAVSKPTPGSNKPKHMGALPATMSVRTSPVHAR